MSVNKIIISALSAGVLTGACKTGEKKSDETEKPNVIFILADDLGYGDLSIFGQKHFTTPHIDKLAREGVVFTNHYSGSTVSAPSRSSLLTGLHTGHTYIRGNREHQPEGQEPLPQGTYTLAHLFKSAGYATGSFGKWGLGYPGSEGDPNNQGFDEFFGYNCQRMAHHYYPYHLWHNQEKIVLEANAGTGTGEYAPATIHQQALKFIENNKNEPFFLFYTSILPHAELLAPEEYMQKYKGKFVPEKAYKGYDEGPLLRRGNYASQPESHAAFAAMINVLDDQVGEIVAKLKELKIDRKTLIVFTSDNGPHKEGGADPDFFDSNGPFRGYKRDLYEGGIRVPFIVWQPQKIEAGETTHISAFWDFMPTVADLLQIDLPVATDGISFAPLLCNPSENQQEHEYLYWEFHEGEFSQAVRMNNWKAIKTGEKIMLFDLAEDEGETTDLSDKFPEIALKINSLMNQAHTKSKIWYTTEQ